MHLDTLITEHTRDYSCYSKQYIKTHLVLPLFSNADLGPFQLQVPGDDGVLCVVVLDDPEGAGVGHVVHVRHVSHHHSLLHHKCHGQEQQATTVQLSKYFSFLKYLRSVLAHTLRFLARPLGNRNDNNSNDKSFRASLKYGSRLC